MTCREHEAQLVDRARGELEPSAAPSLDQHLGNCPACAARLAREMALTADLRLLAAATAGAGPRDGLEQELLRQFALQAGGEPTPRAGAARGGAYRPAWPAWVAAAASVAILAGAAAWRWAPGRTLSLGRHAQVLETTHSVRADAIGEASLASRPGNSSGELLARPVAAPRERARNQASAHGSVAAAGAVAAADDRRAEFLAWPGAEALPTLESGTVVRTELPASVVALLGLEDRAPRWRARVPADVIVGQDGMARAVRVAFER